MPPVADSPGAPTNGRDPKTSILLGALAALAVYLSFRLLQPFATVIVWAGVLAVMFGPLHRRLVARTARPNLAAGLTVVVAMVSVMLPLALISIAVANEVGTMMDALPQRWQTWTEAPANRARLDQLQADLAARFPAAGRFDAAAIRAALAPLGERLLAFSVGFAGGLLQGVLRFLVILFSLFFLLRDGGRFEAGLRRLLPLDDRQSDRLLHRTAEIVQASVLGVVVVASIQGAIGGVTFALLGLPSPILWGVVMAFFAMVPMVGPGAIWLPASIVLLATGEPGKALALVLVGALVIGTIDNFLRPRLVGGRTGLHELVVFFAVLGGLKLLGLVGLLVGPAILAVAWSLLELFRGRAISDGDPPDGGSAAGVEPLASRGETQSGLNPS
jgi:predicted PurR-regulated permease PerM